MDYVESLGRTDSGTLEGLTSEGESQGGGDNDHNSTYAREKQQRVYKAKMKKQKEERGRYKAKKKVFEKNQIQKLFWNDEFFSNFDIPKTFLGFDGESYVRQITSLKRNLIDQEMSLKFLKEKAVGVNLGYNLRNQTLQYARGAPSAFQDNAPRGAQSPTK